jgi:hypothetical protein
MMKTGGRVFRNHNRPEDIGLGEHHVVALDPNAAEAKARFEEWRRNRKGKASIPDENSVGWSVQGLDSGFRIHAGKEQS